jgi:ABC-2 type transport system permease protein
MRSMIALIHRESLEHRGAFIYAPAVLIALFTLAMVSAIALHGGQLPFRVGAGTAMRFYEVVFLSLGGLWFTYLMVALFFYYADAFSADRRNNAMLFWKSMPVSDFGVLASKMLAGMTLLPALIFAMLIVTGLVLYALVALAMVVVPGLSLPGLPEMIARIAELGAFAIVYLALALLWYAPFFSWVGALSTAAGRWSIPLAFLIPGIIGLAENLFLRNEGPRGGYFFDFLRYRAQFGPQHVEFDERFFSDGSFDLAVLGRDLIASIDWTQLAGGLIFAALMVYLASEYRRRVVMT